jgi:hypothetical protein
LFASRRNCRCRAKPCLRNGQPRRHNLHESWSGC